MNPVSRTLIILGGAILLFALTGFAYWYVAIKPDAPLTAPPELVSAALSGDPQEALSDADAFLASHGKDDPAYFAVLNMRAIAAFDVATTSAQRVEAMKIAKSLLVESSNPADHATAVDAVLRMLLLVNDRAMYEEAFRDEPLKSLRVPGRRLPSLRRLGEYSLSIYPTPDAWIYLARVDAEYIESAMKPGSNALRSAATTTMQALKERAANVVTEIANFDALAAKHSNTISPYFPAFSTIWNLWRGLALGAAARVDPTLLAQAEESFQKVIAAGSGTDDGGLLTRITAEAYLAEALTLHAVAGNSRAADIRADLSAFVRLLQESPQLQAPLYARLAAARRGAAVAPAARNTSALYRLYAEYSQLAAVSPEFKAFLKSQGWDL